MLNFCGDFESCDFSLLLLQGSTKHEAKKKVRFAKDMVELIPMENSIMENSMTDRINMAKEQEVIGKVMDLDDTENWKHGEKFKDVMPPNRVVLYRGIMNNRKERFDFQ